MWNDLKFAIRQSQAGWVYTVVAVLTLALGIGANAALFTVVEDVLLRPLGYAHSERLTVIAPKTDKEQFAGTSWLNFRDIRDQAQSFQSVGLYASDVTVVETKDASVGASAPRLTPNVFTMLAVPPLLGRTFSEADAQTGAAPVAILSERLWRRDLHADPQILGRTLKIGGIARTVIGVMPESMRFPDENAAETQLAVWLPLAPTQEMLSQRGYNFFTIIAMLRPGVSVQQAQTELDTISERIRHDNPTLVNSTPPFRASSYQRLLTLAVRPVLLALTAALGLVLLIACANVANLLIARFLGRQQEFAVRSALGAGQLRLVRQLLVEGALLSLLGSALGMLLAQFALQGIDKLPEGTIPGGQSITIHWTLLLSLAAIATLTTILSSLLPALLVARTDPQAGLQAATRGAGTRSVRRRMSGWLVAGEVALSTILLIGTGLLFHTLWNLEHAPLGFAVRRVTMFSAASADTGGFIDMQVSEDTANAPTSVATLLYAPLLERIRHLPGVQSAALITTPPLSGMDMHSDFTIVGQPKDPSRPLMTRVTAVSEDYARTLDTPVLRGRMIDERDVANAPYVVAINETLAKKYFGDQDPLQKQIDLGGKDTGMLKPYTVVGVLGDQVDSSVGGAPDPLVFVPYEQVPTTSLFYQALVQTLVCFAVKTQGDVAVAPAMRSVFHELAPNLALDNFKSMQQMVDESIFSQRLGLYLTAAFAGLAVVMVMAGLSGVLAQLVSYRQREIGIRMALGATRQSVARMILRQGTFLIAAGLGAGILLALAAGRLVTSFLYQVPPTDAWTYVGAIVSLLAVGLLASVLPARKAASIEPMRALRES
jgi:putative ABC transport system permease protein